MIKGKCVLPDCLWMSEQWPETFAALPCVGDYVRSPSCGVDMEVTRVIHCVTPGRSGSASGYGCDEDEAPIPEKPYIMVFLKRL